MMKTKQTVFVTMTLGMTIHDYVQLHFTLHRDAENETFTKSDICAAEQADLPAWMTLMRLVTDGYPVMDEVDYRNAISSCIDEKRALVLKDGDILIGAMTFSVSGIDFLVIHPQYRNQHIQKLFLAVLMERYLPGQEIPIGREIRQMRGIGNCSSSSDLPSGNC